ncbi:hypothetical protein OG471_00640 [Streptomyces sp. NBC_01336]|uniref:hypothetical protein n=1 Tax=Streptomyces sp. NBC_01336 TaxID=2903829 RepID=UPI002E126E03|nr:hypothetical protein OG471_00640 [Streptomyces sp. NBC_01336]
MAPRHTGPLTFAPDTPTADIRIGYASLPSVAQPPRDAELAVLAGLQQVAITLIERVKATESGFARQAGVDRMIVPKWLGM